MGVTRIFTKSAPNMPVIHDERAGAHSASKSQGGPGNMQAASLLYRAAFVHPLIWGTLRNIIY